MLVTLGITIFCSLVTYTHLVTYIMLTVFNYKLIQIVLDFQYALENNIVKENCSNKKKIVECSLFSCFISKHYEML